MPIVVGHEPVAAIQQLGYTAGLGDFQRFLSQRQLAYDQMANQNQMQAHAQQAALFGQRQNLQAQLARDIAQNNWQAARDQRLQQFGLQDIKARGDVNAANDKLQFERDAGLRRELANQNAGLQSQQEERLWANNLMDSMQTAQKQGYEIPKVAYDKAWADYQGVMNNPSLSQQERWQAAGEARRRLEQIVGTAKPNANGPPPTKEQRLDENVVTRPINPSNPTGGNEVWVQQASRNGQPPTFKFDHFRFPDGSISKDGIHPQAAAREKLIQELAKLTLKDAEGVEQFISPEEIQKRLDIIEAARSGKPIPVPPPAPEAEPPSWFSTPEGRKMQAAIQQQQPSGYQPPPPAQGQPAGGPPLPPPEVMEQFEKHRASLKKGTKYVAPDGTTRIKQ